MLVLSRSEGQRIIIRPPGEAAPIEITLLRSGVTTRLGITADRNVAVLRGELVDRDPAARHTEEIS